MPEPKSRRQKPIVRITVLLLIALSLSGLVLNGLSTASIARIWGGLGDRLYGPLHFRVILQPVMAAIQAARAGYRDAVTGRAPFTLQTLTDPATREENLNEALVATSQIILLGLAMDTAYQLIVDHYFFPFEAVVVALLLAFLPYVVLRGPFRRIAGWWLARKG